MRCKSKRGVAAVMAAWCVCDPMVTAAQAKGWSSEMRLLCDLHTIFFLAKTTLSVYSDKQGMESDRTAALFGFAVLPVVPPPWSPALARGATV